MSESLGASITCSCCGWSHNWQLVISPVSSSQSRSSWGVVCETWRGKGEPRHMVSKSRSRLVLFPFLFFTVLACIYGIVQASTAKPWSIGHVSQASTNTEMLYPSYVPSQGSAIAIINQEVFHWEVIAGYMELIETVMPGNMTVYVRRRNSMGNFSDYGFDSLVRPYLHTLRTLPCNLQKHDVLIFISPEYNIGYVRHAIEVSKPRLVLLLVHNGDTPYLATLLSLHPAVRIITLAPHVMSFMLRRAAGSTSAVSSDGLQGLVVSNQAVHAQQQQQHQQSSSVGSFLEYVTGTHQQTHHNQQQQHQQHQGASGSVVSQQPKLQYVGGAARLLRRMLTHVSPFSTTLDASHSESAPVVGQRAPQTEPMIVPNSLPSSSLFQSRQLQSEHVDSHGPQSSHAQSAATMQQWNQQHRQAGSKQSSGRKGKAKGKGRARRRLNPDLALPLTSAAQIEALQNGMWMLPVIDWSPWMPCSNESMNTCLQGFAIQGKINVLKRNYTHVFEQLHTARSECGVDPTCLPRLGSLRVSLLGASWTRLAIPTEIAPFVSRLQTLKFHSFYQKIYNTFALIPALGQGGYYDRKFSSTLITSLVTGTPMVVDAAFLRPYPFLSQDAVILQRPQDILSYVMLKVLHWSSEQHVAKRQAIASLRHRLNKDAQLKLRQLLQEHAILPTTINTATTG